MKKFNKYGNTKNIMKNKYLNLKEKCKLLPDLPGVYIMKNELNKIIYIGKAKNLKNRVSSYFLLNHDDETKVKKMVQNVSNFNYIITDSEFEALVLECSLIKKHQPKYNILLKDSKGYNYIKITHEKWPKILYVKQKGNDTNSTYIGPYISSFSVKNTVKEILKIFKLPNCKRNLEKTYKRPCLNYYINLCCAPCIKKISNDVYINTIKQAENFLKKSKDEVIREIKQEMQKASENMNFELAANLRNRIFAIQKIENKQKVVSYEVKNQDIIASAKNENNICFQIFRFKNYDLYESKNYILELTDTEINLRTEFLKSFYEKQNYIPENIILDGKINDKDLIKKFLSKKSNKKIKIEIPQKSGNQLKLIFMCKENAYENLLNNEINTENKEKINLLYLKNILSLKKFPYRIESYDISNLFGTDCVSSMVVFENGKPLKSNYRKFKLQYGNNDYLSIKNTIIRRFSYTKNDESLSKTPDLILIDGGKGQVSATKEALKELNLENIEVYGMVKDRKHKTKAITTESNEIKIKDNSRLFNFITNIQDEVHRYTINYHRKIRNKKTTFSELTLIKNIGMTRAKNLLKNLKSVENISKCEIKDLVKIESMTEKSAKSVYDYFHE